jgi:hypothetical protein
MTIHQLPIRYGSNLYTFNRFWGLLFVRQEKGIKETSATNVVASHYDRVINPFMLSGQRDVEVRNIDVSYLTAFYAKSLVFACRHSFPIARLLTLIPLTQFNDTATSIAAFQKIFPGGQNQRTLCLPRTLFALSTSCSFRKDGAAFIGVFLPSRKMHAWIIEANANPDPKDDVWICYRPVAAITMK